VGCSDSTPAARWQQAAWPPAPLLATHFASGRGGAELERSRVDQERPGQRAGRDFRSGCGTRGDYSSAGFVGPMPALAIGIIAGAVCYWMVTRVKAIFGYDDALDAFGVHGAAAQLERCSPAFLPSK